MRKNFRHGYTIVELVVTMTIAGVIAAIVVPRLMGRGGFDSRGRYDEAAAAIRTAQKTAVAWRATNLNGRIVFVCVTGVQITVGTPNNCAAPLVGPAGGGLTVPAAPGVTLNTVTFGFDGLGQPTDASGTVLAAATAVTFNSTNPGDPIRQIIVQPQTGYVDAP